MCSLAWLLAERQLKNCATFTKLKCLQAAISGGMKNLVWCLIGLLLTGCATPNSDTYAQHRAGRRSRASGPQLDRNYTWGNEVIPGGHARD